MGEITQHDASQIPSSDAPSLGEQAQPLSGREASLGGARALAHKQMAKRKLAAERAATLAHLPEMRYLIRPGGEIATVQKNLKALPAVGRESVSLKAIVDKSEDYPHFSLGYQKTDAAVFRPVLYVSVSENALTVYAARTPAGVDFPSVDQLLINTHFAKAMAAHMGVGLNIEIRDTQESYQLRSALSLVEGSTEMLESSVITYAPQQLADYAQQRLSI